MKLFSAIFFLFTLTSIGQNINGIVLDKKNNSPLMDVNVFIKKSNYGTSTNKEGNFKLRMRSANKQTDTLYFSMLGYISFKTTFLELKNSNYVVYLSESIEKLKEVTLLSNKELKSKIKFNKLSSLKKGLHSFGSTLVGNKLYIIGGDKSYIEDNGKKTLYQYGELNFDEFLNKLRMNASWENYSSDLQIYDIEKGVWKISDLEFQKRAYHNIKYHNDNLYILGGRRLSTNRKLVYLSDNIEVFDLKNETINTDYSNPHQAINFASFVYKNSIIVMGGSVKLKHNGEKLFTNKSHMYNLESGLWYQLIDMSEAKEANGVLIKNKIYLVGGFNNKPLKDIESYDLSTGKWKKEAELFSGISDPGLTAHHNNIYIYDDGKIYTYNTNTKELNEYLIDLPYKSSELYYFNDKLYLLGGYFENEYSQRPSRNLYSISLNEFDKTRINKSR